MKLEQGEDRQYRFVSNDDLGAELFLAKQERSGFIYFCVDAEDPAVLTFDSEGDGWTHLREKSHGNKRGDSRWCTLR